MSSQTGSPSFLTRGVDFSTVQDQQEKGGVSHLQNNHIRDSQSRLNSSAKSPSKALEIIDPATNKPIQYEPPLDPPVTSLTPALIPAPVSTSVPSSSPSSGSPTATEAPQQPPQIPPPSTGAYNGVAGVHFVPQNQPPAGMMSQQMQQNMMTQVPYQMQVPVYNAAGQSAQNPSHVLSSSTSSHSQPPVYFDSYNPSIRDSGPFSGYVDYNMPIQSSPLLGAHHAGTQHTGPSPMSLNQPLPRSRNIAQGFTPAKPGGANNSGAADISGISQNQYLIHTHAQRRAGGDRLQQSQQLQETTSPRSPGRGAPPHSQAPLPQNPTVLATLSQEPKYLHPHPSNGQPVDVPVGGEPSVGHPVVASESSRTSVTKPAFSTCAARLEHVGWWSSRLTKITEDLRVPSNQNLCERIVDTVDQMKRWFGECDCDASQIEQECSNILNDIGYCWDTSARYKWIRIEGFRAALEKINIMFNTILEDRIQLVNPPNSAPTSTQVATVAAPAVSNSATPNSRAEGETSPAVQNRRLEGTPQPKPKPKTTINSTHSKGQNQRQLSANGVPKHKPETPANSLQQHPNRKRKPSHKHSQKNGASREHHTTKQPNHSNTLLPRHHLQPLQHQPPQHIPQQQQSQDPQQPSQPPPPQQQQTQQDRQQPYQSQPPQHPSKQQRKPNFSYPNRYRGGYRATGNFRGRGRGRARGGGGRGRGKTTSWKRKQTQPKSQSKTQSSRSQADSKSKGSDSKSNSSAHQTKSQSDSKTRDRLSQN